MSRRAIIGWPGVVGQSALQRFEDLVFQRIPPLRRADFRPICHRGQITDSSWYAFTRPCSETSKAVLATAEGVVSAAVREGDAHRHSLAPPRPQWVARRGTAICP